MTPLISFKNVTFGYDPIPVVEDVTFDIAKGDYAAVIGPNGGGKTTLVRLALGLERPAAGAVRLFGSLVSAFHEWKRIGYVPQRPVALGVKFPATVSDVVAQGEYRGGFNPSALLRGHPSADAQDALRTVGMWEYRARLFHELSGGQQQRVLIGRAIVHHPELLVLDEPTTGVDRPGQEQFYTLLRRIRRDHGVTILLVSHDVGVVLREASKLMFIDRHLRLSNAPQELTSADLSEVYGHEVHVFPGSK